MALNKLAKPIWPDLSGRVLANLVEAWEEMTMIAKVDNVSEVIG